MSATLTPQQAAQLDQALRTLAQQVALNTRMHRAGLPQWLDLDALAARYALDAKQVRALIASHGVASVPYGRGLRMHIDDVLRLDDALRQAATAAPARASA